MWREDEGRACSVAAGCAFRCSLRPANTSQSKPYSFGRAVPLLEAVDEASWQHGCRLLRLPSIFDINKLRLAPPKNPCTSTSLHALACGCMGVGGKGGQRLMKVVGSSSMQRGVGQRPTCCAVSPFTGFASCEEADDCPQSPRKRICRLCVLFLVSRGQNPLDEESAEPLWCWRKIRSYFERPVNTIPFSSTCMLIPAMHPACKFACLVPCFATPSHFFLLLWSKHSRPLALSHFRQASSSSCTKPCPPAALY